MGTGQALGEPAAGQIRERARLGTQGDHEADPPGGESFRKKVAPNSNYEVPWAMPSSSRLGLATSIPLKTSLQEDKSFSHENLPFLCIQYPSCRL